MTTEEPTPLTGLLKDAIPTDLRNRMKAHNLETGSWLEPFMDWVDKALRLSKEYYTAVDATGLNHIDGIWIEFMAGTGMDRLDLLMRLIQLERDGLENYDRTPDSEIAEIVAGR